ncbi:MAG: M48 family metalloprotease [Acidobacteria bacterium]|nr:M48 family metalloprotease [Acidobacteriota bacterium]
MKPIVSRRGLWTVGALTVFALLNPPADAHAQIFDRLKRATKKAEEVQKKLEPMSVDEEREVGREVAAKLVAALHLYKDEALTRYVNMVGATVAAMSDRQDIQYHFAVLDSDDINAFSAPGGYVFVTRGAVVLCEDESELAGVLAHEVGHIAGKHVLKIVERDKALRVGMDESKAHVPGSAYLHKMSQGILIKMIDQGLAPGDEYDADQRGMKYAHAAGYPAEGLARFLTKLDQATEQGGKSFWTRTHPPVSERNARIQQTIAAQQWEDADRPKLAERFAAATQALKPKA